MLDSERHRRLSSLKTKVSLIFPHPSFSPARITQARIPLLQSPSTKASYKNLEHHPIRLHSLSVQGSWLNSMFSSYISRMIIYCFFKSHPMNLAQLRHLSEFYRLCSPLRFTHMMKNRTIKPSLEVPQPLQVGHEMWDQSAWQDKKTEIQPRGDHRRDEVTNQDKLQESEIRNQKDSPVWGNAGKLRPL